MTYQHVVGTCVGTSDANASDIETGEAITVARICKVRRGEIRVTVKPWQGQRVIDIRLCR